MSLNDRYNRGGGTGRLENLDRYLTQLGDRAGNAWLDRTGLDRSLLTKGLYLFSAWAGLQHVAVFHDPDMLIIVGIALLSLAGMTQSRGGLVEQIQVEALRLPKGTFAFLRIWLLSLGALSLALAAGYLMESLAMGTSLPMAAPKALLFGSALVALQLSDYIRRTNPTFPSSGLRHRA